MNDGRCESNSKFLIYLVLALLVLAVPLFFALRIDTSYTDSYSKSVELDNFKVTVNSVDKVSESVSRIAGGFRISKNIVSSRSLDLDCKESTHLIMGDIKKFCPRESTLSTPLLAKQITLLSKGDVVTYDIKDFIKHGN